MPKLKVILLILLFLTASPAYAVVEISNGTIRALYHFDGDLTDASGNGYNLTDSGTQTAPGKLGSASRDTVSTGIATGNTNIMDLSGDYTIGFWVNPTSTFTVDWMFFGKRSVTPTIEGPSYATTCVAGEIEFTHNGTCDSIATTTPTANAWTWVVYNRSSTTLTYYLNNISIGTDTEDLTSNLTDDFQLNGSGTFYRRGFYIDELFFATSSLSVATMNSLWNSGSGDTICTSVGCGTPSNRKIRGVGITR